MWAALGAGASFVTGIESRKGWVDKAKGNLEPYKDKIKLIQGGAHEELKNLEPVDVVLCLGFFYHTLRHYELLTQLKRLTKQLLIIDTNLAKHEEGWLKLKLEPTKKNMNATGDMKEQLVGVPTKQAVEMMLEWFGFSVEWMKNIKTGYYGSGKRGTVRCLPIS